MATIEADPSHDLARRVPSSLLWSALASDQGRRIAITDAAGRVLLAGPGGVPFPVLEVLPATVRAELDRTRRRAIEAMSAVSISLVVDGAPVRVTCRPFRDEASGRILLLVVASEIGAETIAPSHTDAADAQVAGLTRRETQILSLIGQGLTTAEIAQKLDRSVKTIEWHRVAIGRKLGARTRVDLARIALRTGLCSLAG